MIFRNLIFAKDTWLSQKVNFHLFDISKYTVGGIMVL